jgi:hypothetical protein
MHDIEAIIQQKQEQLVQIQKEKEDLISKHPSRQSMDGFSLNQYKSLSPCIISPSKTATLSTPARALTLRCEKVRLETEYKTKLKRNEL